MKKLLAPLFAAVNANRFVFKVTGLAIMIVFGLTFGARARVRHKTPSPHFGTGTPVITSFSPLSGSVGNLVTISGSNLSSPTTFTIGGATAIVISNTGSQLVGMVMPGATTGAISLSTAGGTFTTASNFKVLTTSYPNIQQGNKLTGTGSVGPSQQGIAVDISADGNTLIVGGSQDNPTNDGHGTAKGAVWIYTRTNGIWQQMGTKLVAGGNIGNACFGFSVAISADGKTALVGGDTDNNFIGATWVFVRVGSTWVQQAKLVGTGHVGSYPEQGWSVTLSADGNTAVIGGPGDGNPSGNHTPGAIWVFTRTGNTWIQQGLKLVGTGSTGPAEQGLSVKISADGNTIAEGGSIDNKTRGAAWVFTRSGGTWVQQRPKIVGTGYAGPQSAQGSSVGLSADGNTLIVGGSLDNSQLGAAWIFTRSGSIWTQQGNKLVGTGGPNSAMQGQSVSLSADGNTAIVGGPYFSGVGSSWIFTRSGGVWSQQGAELLGSGSVGRSAQGQSVALSANGNYAVIGGKGDNINVGAAWIFASPLQSNVGLLNLSVSNCTLSPAFAVGTNSYTASVSKTVSSVTVKPTAADTASSITVNGTVVKSGAISPAIPLVTGSNVINIKVTAQDGVTTNTYTVTVTKAAGATIAPGAATGSISACAGEASVNPNIQQFTVSGSNLTGNIIATAPTNFQVSLSPGSAYGHAVILAQTGGVVSNQVVYVRSAATAPAGNISGSVVLTSTGASSQNVAVNGTVNALPVVNPVANQTLINGAKTTAVNFTGTIENYTWTNDTPSIGLADSGSGNIAPFTAVNTGSTSVTATVTVTPGSLPARAYIANTGDGTVSVIDVKTKAVIATIPVGLNVDAITVSADGQRAYALCPISAGGSGVYVINTVTNQLITTIPMVGESLLGVVSPDGTRLYVTTAAPNAAIVVINTVSNKQIATIPVSESYGMAVSPDGGKLYAAVRSAYEVDVYNTTNYALLKTIRVQEHPSCVAINADGSRVYVTNTGSYLLSVIDASKNAVIVNIITGQRPIGVAVSADGTRVYTANFTTNDISVFDVTTNSRIADIRVGNNPQAISLTSDGSQLYVSNGGSNNVSIVDTKTWSIIATVPVGRNPNPIGNFITPGNGCPGAPVKFTITVDPIVSTLSNLTLSAGTLSPAFSKDSTSYQVTEYPGINSITVTPTATDAKDVIKVNGITVLSGKPSTAIPLSAGLNTINVVVTAEDGITTKTYTITVGKGSANDNLSSLKLSSGTLSPAFAPTTPNYTATVINTVSSITVTAHSAQTTSTITVNGTPVTSGTASAPIPLNIGTNTIKITVTAQDGITKQTYTVTVTRVASANANLASLKFNPGLLTPVFTAANTSYTIRVINAVGSVKVTPTVADATATVTVNGAPIPSGTATAPIHINVGTNTFTITVTAQNGTTTKTYTVILTRAASSNDNLAALSLSAGTLSPGFAAATTGYTARVVNGVDSVRVMPTAVDANAAITVNGVAVTSGQQSPRFVVNVGDNTFHIIVTAQDGVTSQTYTIVITKLREISHNAYLSYLQLNSNVEIAISPAFGYLTNNYTANVPNSTDSIKVMEVTADGGATATINGIPAAQRTPTAPIALNVGPNTITTVVTAEDGTTTDTYTIVVTRAASGEQSLSETAADGILLHQGLSPNGDGVNDVLTIDGIKQYPDNKLTIINRNGALVFEAKGYDNFNKVFDGHDSKTGKLQLPGTYFYSLEYNVNGVTKHQTGYIVMKY